MCTADAVRASGDAFGSAADALRAAGAAMDYLNSPAVVAGLDGSACGELLIALGEIQAKLTAAHAGLLRRFDAADGHDADGYGSPSAWLAGKAGMSKKAARAAVREMRQLGDRPLLGTALAAGDITDSLAFTIADWTRKLPAQMREETDRILLDAAASGASLDDLATIAAYAIEKWRQQQPDPDDPDDAFEDRSVQVSTTFGGAGVIRGSLTPECAAAVRAVLEALGKKAGPEDNRTEDKRFHDGLQLACELLLRARLVPDRAGADTQVIAHIPISQLRQMPGADELEDAWIRARLGEDGYLTGQDAEAAACDAQTVPVVTGTMDPAVIDQMIDQARNAASRPLSPGAWRALRYAMTKLAVDLVSGPSGIAAVLRRGLLDKPYNTPSLPLDIGYSDSIPWYIRRAVLLRDRTCAWPRCDRPAVYCDVHHLRHKEDGGETSVENCVLACQFHHDVCIHRRGWQLILHPDGTTEARSRDGRQVLYSHAPPTERAALPGRCGIFSLSFHRLGGASSWPEGLAAMVAGTRGIVRNASPGGHVAGPGGYVAGPGGYVAGLGGDDVGRGGGQVAEGVSADQPSDPAERQQDAAKRAADDLHGAAGDGAERVGAAQQVAGPNDGRGAGTHGR